MSDRNKEELLVAHAFKYKYDKGIYVNRDQKKIFSLQYVGNSSFDTLKDSILEKTESGEWEFYFKDPVSNYVQRNIIESLGL